jgi:serine/threonine-protein kinase
MKPTDPNRTRVEVLDPLIGQLIAQRYRLEIKIAQGGFGAIYRALDLRDDRDIAIKLLHPQLTRDLGVIARFRREGAALRALKNPHTVSAFDVGETHDGILYIAMELLEGESLFDHFDTRGPLPWRRMVQIARAVCDALEEAHGLGIIHRDLKPANIHLELRDGGGFVKVLDFGIAKIIQRGAIDNAELTAVGQMIGTFDYMSPEQMVGGECTAQSDIFTLGIVMYEMITGKLPFGIAETPGQMLAALMSKTPRPPSKLAEAPFELDRVVLRCLAKKPQDRYPDVGALVHDLDLLLGAGNEQTQLQRATTKRMAAQSVPEEDVTATTVRMPAYVPAATVPYKKPPNKKR